MFQGNAFQAETGFQIGSTAPVAGDVVARIEGLGGRGARNRRRREYEDQYIRLVELNEQLARSRKAEQLELPIEPPPPVEAKAPTPLPEGMDVLQRIVRARAPVVEEPAKEITPSASEVRALARKRELEEITKALAQAEIKRRREEDEDEEALLTFFMNVLDEDD